ncbi:MAG TPA: hypothetical protein V6D07_14650 [Trichocoleus sp.]
MARLRQGAIAQDGQAARELRIFIREHFTEQVELAVVGEKTEIAIARATDAIYQAVLGHTTRELYSQPGTTPGKRDTLPAAAQNAIAMGECRAAEALEAEVFSGGTTQRIDKVTKICRENGGRVRRWLPW